MNPSMERNNTFLILCVLCVAFIVRIMFVHTLPAALFGDVIEHLKMAHAFNVVRWGGDGALFPLITSMTTRIGGFTFLTLKLTSISISLLGVYVTILYAKALIDNTTAALYAGMFMALSFWDISISHQGKPYILVPLFAVLIAYLLLKKRFLSAGLAIGTALYTQAAAWGLFILSFVHPLTFLGASITGSAFFYELFSKPDTFFTSQSPIGEKLALEQYYGSAFYKTIGLILLNIYKQIQGVFIYGDQGFRSTIPGQAHVDEVTGFFIVVGCFWGIYALRRRLRRQELKSKRHLFWHVGCCLIVPFMLVQIPAALDVHNAGAVPNHGRTVGVIPFLSTIAGYGLWSTILYVKPWVKHRWMLGRRWNNAMIIAIFLLVGSINVYRYWFIYPKTLPDHNVPFAEVISAHAAQMNADIPVIVYGCCWGQWGQPEPGAFAFLPNNGYSLYPPATKETLCSMLDSLSSRSQHGGTIIFADPQDTEVAPLVSSCGWHVEKEIIIVEKDEAVAKQLTVTKKAFLPF